MLRPRRGLALAALPFAVAACTSSPLEQFELSPVPAIAAQQTRAAVISIEEPTATALLASNRVVVRRPGADLAYLAGAQWSDVLTQLVQRRIIEGFQNAHLFRAVAETGTASDYILSMDIRRFEADGETNRAVVEIAVRLVDARTGRTMRGAVVSGSAPAPTQGPAAITASIDAAFAEAAGKILQFAVSRT